MTQNDWILDVLADLNAFASSNGLNALAEHLDDTMLIAAGEIASKRKEALVLANGDNAKTGTNTRCLDRHQQA